MINKKYELIPEPNGFFRIRALRSFNNVVKGDLGGIVSSEHNLSHEGDCWIGEKATVINRASVSDNAQVMGWAVVSDHAVIRGNGYVGNNAEVSDYAVVLDNAQVYGYAKVRGHACVSDKAQVYGAAIVMGDYYLCGDTHVSSGILDKVVEKPKRTVQYLLTYQDVNNATVNIFGDKKYINRFLKALSDGHAPVVYKVRPQSLYTESYRKII